MTSPEFFEVRWGITVKPGVPAPAAPEGLFTAPPVFWLYNTSPPFHTSDLEAPPHVNGTWPPDPRHQPGLDPPRTPLDISTYRQGVALKAAVARHREAIDALPEGALVLLDWEHQNHMPWAPWWRDYPQRYDRELYERHMGDVLVYGLSDLRALTGRRVGMYRTVYADGKPELNDREVTRRIVMAGDVVTVPCYPDGALSGVASITERYRWARDRAAEAVRVAGGKPVYGIIGHAGYGPLSPMDARTIVRGLRAGGATGVIWWGAARSPAESALIERTLAACAAGVRDAAGVPAAAAAEE
jgi:hypothetical protein